MISAAVEKFFQTRGIDPETATAAGIYSEDSGKGTVIVFPSVEEGKAVNLKYRGQGKKFWQSEGGKKTFWNVEAIDAASEADKPLVITEGEIDALSVLEAGYPYVVSVPDGAPAKEVEDPDSRKFEYVANNEKRLEAVRTIILAGDGDGPGQILNGELKRRLGDFRCKFVEYPEPKEGFERCKDLNDVLVQYGAVEVRNVIERAKPYPIKGLYTLDDFPDLPRPTVYSTGFPCMDPHMMIELSRLMIVTGVPGHGKSEWTDTLVYNLAQKYGWHACVATFENAPAPHWRDKMLRKMCGCDPAFAASDKKAAALKWISNQFTFICQNPGKDEDEDLDLDFIIERAEYSVIKHGTKVLVIDPWNEIEHKRQRGETETDYISTAIRKLKRFARAFEVLVIVVAHPQKMNQQGDIKRPHLYDISGSANWYNKADYGVVVWRPDIQSSKVEIFISKVKNHDYMGKPGQVDLDYVVESGGYLQYVSDKEFQKC